MRKEEGYQAVWGTDVEVQVAATMLQCDIYIYQKIYEGKCAWIKFSPVFFNMITPPQQQIGPVLCDHQESIYLANVSGVHFESVVGLKC